MKSQGYRDSKGNTRLSTKNVFVDSSLHIGAKFSYSRGILRRLADLAAADVVHVFDTLVDVGEIRANIRTLADSAAAGLRTFRKEAAALKDLTEARELFAAVDTDEIGKLLLQGYDRFRAEVKVTNLPLTAPGDIFYKYFSAKAPFGTAKKRSEFPDAFIIGALEAWCHENAQSMYMVSADGGMRAAAIVTGVLIPLERVEQLLDLIVSEKHQSVAIKLQNWLLAWRPNLIDKITEAFQSTGFFIEDAEGDAEEIEVEHIAASEPLLVEVNPEQGIFEIPTEITFTACLSYDDPDSWVYDSEDKTVSYLRRRRTRVRRTEEVTVELVVDTGSRDNAPLSEPSPVRLTINEGEDIPVSVEDEVVEEFSESDDEFSWFEEYQ